MRRLRFALQVFGWWSGLIPLAANGLTLAWF